MPIPTATGAPRNVATNSRGVRAEKQKELPLVERAHPDLGRLSVFGNDVLPKGRIGQEEGVQEPNAAQFRGGLFARAPHLGRQGGFLALQILEFEPAQECALAVRA
ncbi:MAG: hypothetical protein ABSE73_13265, partial [Planctomycetota bacterium]